MLKGSPQKLVDQPALRGGGKLERQGECGVVALTWCKIWVCKYCSPSIADGMGVTYEAPVVNVL